MDHTPANDDASFRPSPLRELSFRQRTGLGVAALIVIVGLAWTAQSRTSTELVPLPTNEPLTAATAGELESTLRAAGLTDFRRTGDQILVPAAQLEQYATRLTTNPTKSDHWADEWERQNERLTPFSSHRDREANREIARARLITGMLQQLPDVQQADLVWDEEEQPGWRTATKARATVYLQPKPNRVLTVDVIRSVRLAVAGSKKNLDPADVAVMDLARQITYEGPLPATLGDDLLPSLRSLAELYRREIQQQIPELTTADVAVSVDLPRFFAFVAEHPQDADRKLAATAPTLLRVAATLPHDPDSATLHEETTRRTLSARIVALTGIGETAADRSECIAIVFEQPPASPKANHAAWSQAALAMPSDWRRYAIALGGVLLISLSVLLRRRSQRRPKATLASFPTLHAVNRSAESFDCTPSMATFDDLTHLDRPAVRSIYSHATPRRWAVALRGSSVGVRDHIAAALDPLDAADLRKQCEALGPVTVGDIESSRQRIFESAQQSTTP